MSVHVNTLANVIGRVWNAAIGALLIPLYVRMLGVESYALVGISATLQTIFGLLDLGLGAGLNRELARLAATEANEQQRRDLLATFDVAGALLGACIAMIIFALAPVIAYRWVNAQELDRAVIVDAIRMMGIVIGLQLPIGFYHGGLNGLERQVLFNGLSITINTIRGVGALGALVFVGATIRVFFAWQVCVTALAAVIWGVAIHRAVDRQHGRGRAARAHFRAVWHYSAGWLGNSVGLNLLGQTDKLVLSRLLPLRDFGYYTFASYGGLLLWNVVASVSAAFFPRFNALIARDDEAGLAAEYRRGNQILATLLVPVSFVILFFPRQVLTVWTRDPALTAATTTLLAIFAAGMTVVGLANIAYTTALCEGMFRTTIMITACLAVVWVPSMLFAAKTWGVVGGAAVWALMNASWALIVPLLHRRHLRGEGWIWLRQALLVPALTAAVVCGIARAVAPPLTHPIATLAYLGVTWLFTVLAVGSAEPAVRSAMSSLYRKLAMAGSH